jgi:hypothetical protein
MREELAPLREERRGEERRGEDTVVRGEDTVER